MKIGACEAGKATWICLDVSLHRISSETSPQHLYDCLHAGEVSLECRGLYPSLPKVLSRRGSTNKANLWPISLHKSVSGDTSLSNNETLKRYVSCKNPTLSSLELCRETCRERVKPKCKPNWTDTMKTPCETKFKGPICYIYRDRREETATPNCQKHLAVAFEDLEAILSLDLEGLYSTARV